MEVYDYGAYEADRLNSQKRLGRISDRKKTSFWNEEVDNLRKEAIKFFTEFSELEYFVWKNPDVEGIWVADDEYGYAILR
jgi:hypothetical protein